VGEVFNVGNDRETAIRSLADMIKAMIGSASPIVTVPYDEAYEAGFEDMARRVPDLAKVRGLIGYEPRVQLERIITEVVEYQRAQRSTI
jgi:UDP-glucose 4-epimerase